MLRAMDQETLQRHAWPPNHVHRLRELIAAEFSAGRAASALSQEFGVEITRDSAKQKARTIGLRFTSRAGRPATVEGSTEANGYHPETLQPDAGRDWRQRVSGFRLQPRPLPLDELRNVPARGEPRSIVDAPACGCRWPVSGWLEEGNARTPFCCADAAPGKPYCPDHAAIAYIAAA